MLHLFRLLVFFQMNMTFFYKIWVNTAAFSIPWIYVYPTARGGFNLQPQNVSNESDKTGGMSYCYREETVCFVLHLRCAVQRYKMHGHAKLIPSLIGLHIAVSPAIYFNRPKVQEHALVSCCALCTLRLF